MRTETTFELGDGLVIGGEGRSACLQGYRKKDKVQAAQTGNLPMFHCWKSALPKLPLTSVNTVHHPTPSPSPRHNTHCWDFVLSGREKIKERYKQGSGKEENDKKETQTSAPNQTPV